MTARSHWFAPSRTELIKRIADTVLRESPDALIVGLPLNMDNSLGKPAREAIQFGQSLSAHLANLPVHFVDEQRLSTFKVAELPPRRTVAAAARNSPAKKKQRQDAAHAAAFLQEFTRRLTSRAAASMSRAKE